MRQCFLCGSNGAGLPIETHHIFPAALRKKSHKYGLTVDLCHWCHNEPPRGVHQNAETREIIQRYGQQKAMSEQGWTERDFIREFGKNYL